MLAAAEMATEAWKSTSEDSAWLMAARGSGMDARAATAAFAQCQAMAATATARGSTSGQVSGEGVVRLDSSGRGIEWA